MLGNRVQNSCTEHVCSGADYMTMWRCRDTPDAVRLSSSDIIRTDKGLSGPPVLITLHFGSTLLCSVP